MKLDIGVNLAPLMQVCVAGKATTNFTSDRNDFSLPSVYFFLFWQLLTEAVSTGLPHGLRYELKQRLR